MTTYNNVVFSTALPQKAFTNNANIFCKIKALRFGLLMEAELMAGLPSVIGN